MKHACNIAWAICFILFFCAGNVAVANNMGGGHGSGPSPGGSQGPGWGSGHGPMSLPGSMPGASPGAPPDNSSPPPDSDPSATAPPPPPTVDPTPAPPPPVTPAAAPSPTPVDPSATSAAQYPTFESPNADGTTTPYAVLPGGELRQVMPDGTLAPPPQPPTTLEVFVGTVKAFFDPEYASGYNGIMAPPIVRPEAR